ncbi:allophanate hydrolase subunit 1 [Edaphobacter lichenicola]|uniref:Allophanate hydrolase subunit 1 n=1 Tax=Tunturiibacter gelidiferens TaxID=3069689 RepID=A0A9X0QJ13_9BACT|nr:allophanate hydrolase subunit 1 [Edaphobacter lichenicola]
MKVDGFWLPERNHSITEIRLGTAELTIHYSNYRIMSKEQVSNLSTPESARTADTIHAQR